MSSATCTLVTGATSGIGRAITDRLSSSRRLILHGRDAVQLNAALGNCHFSKNHLIWRHDLADAAGVANSLAEMLGNAGVAVDEFVHCAGMAGLLPARSAGVEATIESLNVNFVSAQQIVATLLKKKVNSGTLRNVVAVSSISSRFGVKGYSLYCAAKAALDGWVRALAVELAPGVRVNSVQPGAVLTSTTTSALSDPELNRRILNAHPLGVGQPDDVACMVEYLLSKNSRWITGQQFVVDGGFSADGTA
ncbi:MAG: SDR family oxidoreductase [Verrucomicrobiota bacterium]